MTDKLEILDPYGEPDDESKAEKAIVHSVSTGTGSRLFRTAAIGPWRCSVGSSTHTRKRSQSDVKLAEDAARTGAEPPTVEVLTVTRSDPLQTITLPGEAAAWDETTIYSRVNGYVSKWFVDIGESCRCGETLATIENAGTGRRTCRRESEIERPAWRRSR